MGFLANSPETTGNLQDMVGRLRSTLPDGWFPGTGVAEVSNSPVLDGVLSGIAAAWSFCFGLLKAASQQTRLDTATGSSLDLISQDLFGAGLPRKPSEADVAFRTRIVAGMQVQRGTRQDVVANVTAATSIIPFICEPRRGLDCGGIGGASAPGAGGGQGMGCVRLRYGSDAMAFQYLLTCSSVASFAPGYFCVRGSVATYIDNAGVMRLAATNVLRPAYQAGAAAGPLVESRACNLIRDSVNWTGFTENDPAGAAAISWTRLVTPLGVLAAQPVMSISVGAGSALIGPTVTVAAASALVTGSLWIAIETLAGLGSIELVARDLSNGHSATTEIPAAVPAGAWQRATVSLQLAGSVGLNFEMGLRFTNAAGVAATVLTQCWQVETGGIATSFIPTSGTIGFRQADSLVPVEGPATPLSLGESEVFEAITSCIPVATIAWSQVSLPINP